MRSSATPMQGSILWSPGDRPRGRPFEVDDTLMYPTKSLEAWTATCGRMSLA